MTSRIRRWAARLINVLHPNRAEPDLARELDAHLSLMQDDFVRRGMTPDQARVAAHRAFGGVELAKDLHRDARSIRWLDDARRDAVHAARLLRRDPLFTITAALSLAIGIGANTTIFTVANALVAQPPAGVAAPERVVDVGSTHTGGGFGPSSYPNYLDIRQRTTLLDGVFAYSRFPEPLSVSSAGGALTDSVFGAFVTANYFNVLGAVPAAGRLFGTGDSDRSGASPVAVLGHGFWTRRFNRDPAIIGQTLLIGGHPFTVAGVAAEGFHGTGVRALDVWLPIGMHSTVSAGATPTPADRALRRWLIGGRLKPGVPIARAAAEMKTIGRTLEREFPEENRDTGLGLSATSNVPGNRGPVIAFLALLAAIVSFVLIIACANVAGVLLARATARRQEMALRLAIGAGRGRLVRQLLTETVLLFVLGGAAGLWLARAMTAVIVSQLPALPLPVALMLTLDSRAVGFTVCLSLVAALLSGLAPALYASRPDILPGLRADAMLLGRLRLRHAFVVGQVACSLVLVIGAGLFVRALQRASLDPGFDPHGVELVSVDLAQAGYDKTTGARIGREIADRVRRLPGVRSATIAASLPGGFEVRREGLTVPGVVPPNGQRFFGVDWNVVEPGYFATLGAALVTGRDFSMADRDDTQSVAIVSESAARQMWPGQVAVGKELQQFTHGPHGPTGPMRTLLVIGVARDLKSSSVIDGFSGSCVYVPFQQQYLPAVTIVARTTSGQRIGGEIRSLLASVDPALAIGSTQTLEESVSLGILPQRVAASVSGILGFVGLTLAAIGIYGVTAYAVTRRIREIGVRIALGARRTDIVKMVLWEGMSLTLIGSAIGLVLAAAVSRVLAGFLFGLPPIDPATFGGTALLFAAIGLAACCAPLRRALRIDPLQALRYE